MMQVYTWAYDGLLGEWRIICLLRYNYVTPPEQCIIAIQHINSIEIPKSDWNVAVTMVRVVVHKSKRKLRFKFQWMPENHGFKDGCSIRVINCSIRVFRF